MRILSSVTRPASAPRIPAQEEIERTGTRRLFDRRRTVQRSQELVGGYVLFDVPERAAAIALTRRFFDASGNGTCSLHEIVSAP
jgi:hypothetical protein